MKKQKIIRVACSGLLIAAFQYPYGANGGGLCLYNYDCPRQQYCFAGQCNADQDPSYPPSFGNASGQVNEPCTYNRHCTSGLCSCNGEFPTCAGRCMENCSGGCSNCTSTQWASSGTGYETRTYATCDCKTCTKSTEYRCAAGYYGSSTNGTSGCTRCPSSGGIYGTSAAGSTAITSCYIPSGTSMSDSTGTYTYTDNCYYTN